MSLDFSSKPELAALSRLVRALQAVAGPLGIPFFLMGAAARDLRVHYAHGIEPNRATQDADFAMMVRNWSTAALRRPGRGRSTSFPLATSSERTARSPGRQTSARSSIASAWTRRLR
ncbi:MAG: hypothetical protein IPP91_16080 [Betaproteobacteria bacterium]|nr:hypothetical protein [Betaproteobacteria bacterium]